jgi:hypothetical protein
VLKKFVPDQSPSYLRERLKEAKKAWRPSLLSQIPIIDRPGTKIAITSSKI